MILIYSLLDSDKSTVALFVHRSQVGIKYPEQSENFRHSKCVVK